MRFQWFSSLVAISLLSSVPASGSDYRQPDVTGGHVSAKVTGDNSDYKTAVGHALCEVESDNHGRLLIWEGEATASTENKASPSAIVLKGNTYLIGTIPSGYESIAEASKDVFWMTYDLPSKPFFKLELYIEAIGNVKLHIVPHCNARQINYFDEKSYGTYIFGSDTSFVTTYGLNIEGACTNSYLLPGSSKFVVATRMKIVKEAEVDGVTDWDSKVEFIILPSSSAFKIRTKIGSSYYYLGGCVYPRAKNDWVTLKDNSGTRLFNFNLDSNKNPVGVDIYTITKTDGKYKVEKRIYNDLTDIISKLKNTDGTLNNGALPDTPLKWNGDPKTDPEYWTSLGHTKGLLSIDITATSSSSTAFSSLAPMCFVQLDSINGNKWNYSLRVNSPIGVLISQGDTIEFNCSAFDSGMVESTARTIRGGQWFYAGKNGEVHKFLALKTAYVTETLSGFSLNSIDGCTNGTITCNKNGNWIGGVSLPEGPVEVGGPRPRLSIAPSTTGFKIGWDTNAVGYTLQSSEDSTGVSSWKSLQTIKKGFTSTNVLNNAKTKYFRLRKPL